MSIILTFYDIKATVFLPETFAKLIQRARLDYSFKENNINEGLLIYTYRVDSMLYGISSESEYNKFKDFFVSNKVNQNQITIQEKQGNAEVICKTDAVHPEEYEDYMTKVIQREMELAGERIKTYLLKEHVMSSHFHDHKKNCYNCKANIIGYLYKCTICDDIALCEGCMNKVIEHKHPFFKIR